MTGLTGSHGPRPGQNFPHTASLFPLMYLVLVMLAYPKGICLRTHFALTALFARG